MHSFDAIAPGETDQRVDKAGGGPSLLGGWALAFPLSLVLSLRHLVLVRRRRWNTIDDDYALVGGT